MILKVKHTENSIDFGNFQASTSFYSSSFSIPIHSEISTTFGIIWMQKKKSWLRSNETSTKKKETNKPSKLNKSANQQFQIRAHLSHKKSTNKQ